MRDSGKLNPAMVSVPFGVVDDGEPPPDDPQALPMRLSPRIVESRAGVAHLGIAIPPGRRPVLAARVSNACADPASASRSGRLYRTRRGSSNGRSGVRLPDGQYGTSTCGATTRAVTRRPRPAAERS